jgi:putative glutamine amidotransferase
MKKIAIVGWKTGENSFGVTLPYIEFFSEYGNVEIISATEENVRDVDLLVLPGGPDVDPSRYGVTRLDYRMGKQCPFRERFDNVLLPKYVEEKIPIFGICRGHQSFAVYNGATLVQDMYHSTNSSHDRSKLVHKLKFNNDIIFYGLIAEKNNFEVNSIHHQTVDSVNLPPNIDVLAYNPSDNEIEALAYNDYPAFTVQYHPEETGCNFARQMIDILLNDNKNNLIWSKNNNHEKLSI